MSYHNGPRIVTNGLVLYLDAGIAKSYPGSGTVWTDLSGNNNNGTLVNGPTYNSDNKGSIVFDGSNDYIQVAYQGSLVINSAISICLWFSSSQTWNTNYWPGSATIISKATAGAGSSDWTILGGKKNTESGNAGRIIVGVGPTSQAGDTLLYSNSNMNDSKWHYLTWTRTSGGINLLYIDNIINDSVNDNGGLISANRPIQIGGDQNVSGSYLNGNISNVQIYNRAISSSEVQQNYNALKGRYNL